MMKACYLQTYFYYLQIGRVRDLELSYPINNISKCIEIILIGAKSPGDFKFGQDRWILNTTYFLVWSMMGTFLLYFVLFCHGIPYFVSN